MHEVFYCGTGSSRRMAIYHAPVASARDEIVVVCPPTFSEHSRTYLALRELALALSDHGFHVVRFDYRGTGDSAGNLEDVAYEDWITDCTAIAEEGLAITGCSRACALGVRLGALVATDAHRLTGTFDRFVLWDPILSGEDYVRSLTRRKSLLWDGYTAWRASTRSSGGRPEFGGYVVSQTMSKRIAASVFQIPESMLGSSRIVRTDDTASDSRYESITIRVPFECNWDAHAEDLMIPRPVLDCLLAEIISTK